MLSDITNHTRERQRAHADPTTLSAFSKKDNTSTRPGESIYGSGPTLMQCIQQHAQTFLPGVELIDPRRRAASLATQREEDGRAFSSAAPWELIATRASIAPMSTVKTRSDVDPNHPDTTISLPKEERPAPLETSLGVAANTQPCDESTTTRDCEVITHEGMAERDDPATFRAKMNELERRVQEMLAVHTTLDAAMEEIDRVDAERRTDLAHAHTAALAEKALQAARDRDALQARWAEARVRAAQEAEMRAQREFDLTVKQNGGPTMVTSASGTSMPTTVTHVACRQPPAAARSIAVPAAAKTASVSASVATMCPATTGRQVGVTTTASAAATTKFRPPPPPISAPSGPYKKVIRITRPAPETPPQRSATPPPPSHRGVVPPLRASLGGFSAISTEGEDGPSPVRGSIRRHHRSSLTPRGESSIVDEEEDSVRIDSVSASQQALPQWKFPGNGGGGSIATASSYTRSDSGSYSGSSAAERRRRSRRHQQSARAGSVRLEFVSRTHRHGSYAAKAATAHDDGGSVITDESTSVLTTSTDSQRHRHARRRGRSRSSSGDPASRVGTVHEALQVLQSLCEELKPMAAGSPAPLLTEPVTKQKGRQQAMGGASAAPTSTRSEQRYPTGIATTAVAAAQAMRDAAARPHRSQTQAEVDALRGFIGRLKTSIEAITLEAAAREERAALVEQLLALTGMRRQLRRRLAVEAAGAPGGGEGGPTTTPKALAQDIGRRVAALQKSGMWKGPLSATEAFAKIKEALFSDGGGGAGPSKHGRHAASTRPRARNDYGDDIVDEWESDEVATMGGGSSEIVDEEGSIVDSSVAKYSDSIADDVSGNTTVTPSSDSIVDDEDGDDDDGQRAPDTHLQRLSRALGAAYPHTTTGPQPTDTSQMEEIDVEDDDSEYYYRNSRESSASAEGVAEEEGRGGMYPARDPVLNLVGDAKVLAAAAEIARRTKAGKPADRQSMILAALRAKQHEQEERLRFATGVEYDRQLRLLMDLNRRRRGQDASALSLADTSLDSASDTSHTSDTSSMVASRQRRRELRALYVSRRPAPPSAKAPPPRSPSPPSVEASSVEDVADDASTQSVSTGGEQSSNASSRARTPPRRRRRSSSSTNSSTNKRRGRRDDSAHSSRSGSDRYSSSIRSEPSTARSSSASSSTKGSSRAVPQRFPYPARPKEKHYPFPNDPRPSWSSDFHSSRDASVEPMTDASSLSPSRRADDGSGETYPYGPFVMSGDFVADVRASLREADRRRRPSTSMYGTSPLSLSKGVADSALLQLVDTYAYNTRASLLTARGEVAAAEERRLTEELRDTPGDNDNTTRHEKTAPDRRELLRTLFATATAKQQALLTRAFGGELSAAATFGNADDHDSEVDDSTASSATSTSSDDDGVPLSKESCTTNNRQRSSGMTLRRAEETSAAGQQGGGAASRMDSFSTTHPPPYKEIEYPTVFAERGGGSDGTSFYAPLPLDDAQRLVEDELANMDTWKAALISSLHTHTRAHTSHGHAHEAGGYAQPQTPPLYKGDDNDPSQRGDLDNLPSGQRLWGSVEAMVRTRFGGLGIATDARAAAKQYIDAVQERRQTLISRAHVGTSDSDDDSSSSSSDSSTSSSRTSSAATVSPPEDRRRTLPLATFVSPPAAAAVGTSPAHYPNLTPSATTTVVPSQFHAPPQRQHSQHGHGPGEPPLGLLSATLDPLTATLTDTSTVDTAGGSSSSTAFRSIAGSGAAPLFSLERPLLSSSANTTSSHHFTVLDSSVAALSGHVMPSGALTPPFSIAAGGSFSLSMGGGGHGSLGTGGLLLPNTSFDAPPPPFASLGGLSLGGSSAAISPTASLNFGHALLGSTPRAAGSLLGDDTTPIIRPAAGPAGDGPSPFTQSLHQAHGYMPSGNTGPYTSSSGSERSHTRNGHAIGGRKHQHIPVTSDSESGSVANEPPLRFRSNTGEPPTPPSSSASHPPSDAESSTDGGDDYDNEDFDDDDDAF